MDEIINAQNDEHSALRLSMAACIGVAALSKWVAANSTNPRAAHDIHKLMRENMLFDQGVDKEKTFEFIMLRSLFGNENTPS